MKTLHLLKERRRFSSFATRRCGGTDNNVSNSHEVYGQRHSDRTASTYRQGLDQLSFIGLRRFQRNKGNSNNNSKIDKVQQIMDRHIGVKSRGVSNLTVKEWAKKLGGAKSVMRNSDQIW